MPDLEALDQFKDFVNSLGDEPRILAERGETLEDVPRPEQGLSDDLSELLGDTTGLEEEEPAAEGVGDDLNALLSGFGDDQPADSEETAAEDQPFEDFDFSDDLDDLDSLESILPQDEEGAPEIPLEPEPLDEPAGFDETEPPLEEEPEAPADEPDEDIDLDALIAETSPESRAPEPEPDTDLEISEGEPDDLDEGMMEIGDLEIEETGEAEEGGFELDIDSELDELGDLGDIGDLGESEEFGLDIDSDLDDLGGIEEPEEFPEEEVPAGSEEASEDEAGFEDEFNLDEVPGDEEEPVEDDLGGIEDEFAADTEITDEFSLDLDTELGEEDGEGEFPFEDEAPGGETDEFDLGGEGNFDFEDVPSADDFSLPDEEEGDDDFEVDQFDLGELSEDFDLGGEEETEAPGFAQLPEVSAVEEIYDEDFEISDNEFLSIRRTLGNLPRNLKMIIEELIGEKGLSGDQLKTLLDMLSSGKSPKAIAAETGKITGKKIEIPDSYEKKTGAEFESEQQSFSYVFKTKIFPYLKIGAAVVVVLGFLVFLGYRFIYKPLHANSLYRQGYEALQAEEYVPAKDNFSEAFEVKPKKDWFYKYAEGYIDKKQYSRAEEMYDWLVGTGEISVNEEGKSVIHKGYEFNDMKGLMDYAYLESNILFNYPKAEKLLKRVIDEDMYNFDALLAAGDNYLMWAADDESKYEKARFTYATLLQRYGGRHDILQRMLRYFIRTDNYAEVKRLVKQFQADSGFIPDPNIYAELAGYLIDYNQMSEVKDILFRAMEQDRNIPEVHYHLARYYRELEDYGEEEKALRNALRFLQEVTPFTSDRLAKLIDTNNRIGESFYRKKEYLQAEQSFQEGISLYEDALERRLIGPADKFGKLYSNLGDIYYYISGNYKTAFDLYKKSENNLHSTRDIDYKQGYIQYKWGGYRDSLTSFYEAAGSFSDNKNLMYATANNLYQRGEYFAAQGYYNHLLDILELEKDTIPYLLIDERDDHRGIVEYLMKVYNNLGVTLNRLSEQSDDSTKYSRALAYLTKSTEYADVLSRDFETLERSNALDLADLNLRSIMYPKAQNVPQIYSDLPLDMEDVLF